jgi:hypothetical protein
MSLNRRLWRVIAVLTMVIVALTVILICQVSKSNKTNGGPDVNNPITQPATSTSTIDEPLPTLSATTLATNDPSSASNVEKTSSDSSNSNNSSNASSSIRKVTVVFLSAVGFVLVAGLAIWRRRMQQEQKSIRSPMDMPQMYYSTMNEVNRDLGPVPEESSQTSHQSFLSVSSDVDRSAEQDAFSCGLFVDLNSDSDESSIWKSARSQATVVPLLEEIPTSSKRSVQSALASVLRGPVEL